MDASLEQKASEKKVHSKKNELKEGVDFYVENGRWVFTTSYHIRRGYCCGNGCRHCPYSKK